MLEEYDTWSQVFNQATKIPSSDSQGKQYTYMLGAIRELKCFSDFQ